VHPADVICRRLQAFEGTPQGSAHLLSIDQDAEFTALVQRQSRFVFRVAYAVVLNSYDAEDVVQETFLKLYRNHGWRNVENERAFLARVAWRIAVDRRPRWQETVSLNAEAESERNVDVTSPRPGPELDLIAANQHARIHALIDALPEELRVPLVLSANEELNSREIGRILGIPEGTVRTRLQRARQLLRQKLEAGGQPLFTNRRVQEAPHA
jgi:RNA polymerase sigma-70 factor (ECF subfamily)